MSFIADIQAGGVWPLRDHRRDVPIETRLVRHSMRVVSRDQFGRPSARDGQDDTFGDVLGAMHWPADTQKRPSGAWAFAWPVVTATDMIFTPPSVGGVCSTLPRTALKMRPIGDKNYRPDLRFNPLDVNLFPEWTPPLGARGIALCSTKEGEQENLFFPIDNRLWAVNRNGDPMMGSVVFDLKGDFTASAFFARLQSAWWTIKTWGANGTLAINLNDTGCEDARGGLMIDKPSPHQETIETPDGGRSLPPPQPPDFIQSGPTVGRGF